MTHFKVNKVDYTEFKPAAAANAAASPVETVDSDSFLTQGADHFKGLITGKTEEIAPIEQMKNVAENVQLSAQEDPIQALIGEMMMGDEVASKLKVDLSEIPAIPDLHKEIFKYNPEMQFNMEPIVERYEGLQTTLEDMFAAVNEALRPQNAFKMAADEIQITWDKREALKEALFEVRKQLEESKLYYRWQEQDLAASRAES